jgi:hypothetical protein
MFQGNEYFFIFILYTLERFGWTWSKMITCEFYACGSPLYVYQYHLVKVFEIVLYNVNDTHICNTYIEIADMTTMIIFFMAEWYLYT